MRPPIPPPIIVTVKGLVGVVLPMVGLFEVGGMGFGWLRLCTLVRRIGEGFVAGSFAYLARAEVVSRLIVLVFAPLPDTSCLSINF